MKIKQTRQVRLDELIGYITKNELISSVFKSNRGNEIVVDINGDLSFFGRFNYNDLFVITEEVDITEDTVIDLAYRIETEKGWKTFDKHGVTINKIIDTYKKHINVYLGFIYLLNDDCGIGDLIWTKERGLID